MHRWLRARSRSGRVLNYPAHWPGLALLILRCALGLTLVDGAWRAAPSTPADLAGVLAAIVQIACGVALSLGILTPLCGAIVSLSHVLTLLHVPDAAMSSHASTASEVVGLAAALATAVLGPGAFSIDAHLFGRHRILIRGRRDQE